MVRRALRSVGLELVKERERERQFNCVNLTLGKTKFVLVAQAFSGSVENQDPQETCAVHYKHSGMLS